LVKVEQALPLISPAYDSGLTEEAVREHWLSYWRSLYFNRVDEKPEEKD